MESIKEIIAKFKEDGQTSRAAAVNVISNDIVALLYAAAQKAAQIFRDEIQKDGQRDNR